MKFNNEVKAEFIKVYNNPEIPSKNIHIALTEIGHKQGWLEPNVEFKANVVRAAIEGKLGKLYKNRKRKVADEIEFETGEEEEVVAFAPIEAEPAEETNW